MEFIDMRFIMNRLLDNPMMRNLKLSSAASYVKDFSSINAIAPIKGFAWTYSKIIGYNAPLPANMGDIIDVYLCNATFPASMSQNNRLSASLKNSKIPNIIKSLDPSIPDTKVEYGQYTRKGDTMFTDIETGVLEVYHSCMRVDEQGFPMLPYDGSLMEAVTNYIKYRYYTILWENKLMDRQTVDNADREYVWYLGQYTMKNTIPTYDEAIAWANSWQRLLNDRNLDLDALPYPEQQNF
jgi:hypothetical protein